MMVTTVLAVLLLMVFYGVHRHLADIALLAVLEVVMALKVHLQQWTGVS